MGRTGMLLSTEVAVHGPCRTVPVLREDVYNSHVFGVHLKDLCCSRIRWRASKTKQCTALCSKPSVWITPLLAR